MKKQILIGLIATLLLSQISLAQTFERREGESYKDYVERYKSSMPNAADKGMRSIERSKIVARCRDAMGEYGPSMVKACADRDIEAQHALRSYPSRYSSIIHRCTESMGEYGYDMIKACADRDIEAEKALQNY